jgi:hypothetical protein
VHIKFNVIWDPIKLKAVLNIYRGKSPIMGRCIISHQEVLRPLLKNVNPQADETLLSSHGINGQLLRTSVVTGSLCFGEIGRAHV